MTNPYWQASEPEIEHKNTPVSVHRRMTQYEVSRFRDKADELLSAVSNRGKYEVVRLHAYGHAHRIGAKLKINRDPLHNGVITTNIDGFAVESVKPTKEYDHVCIRFMKESE